MDMGSMMIIMIEKHGTVCSGATRNPSDGNQRNDKFNSKGKRRAGNQGRGQAFKKARNSRMY